MLDLDVELKLKLVGMSHLIRKVRELGRELDSVTMKMLDHLVATKANRSRIYSDELKVKLSPIDRYYAALELPRDATKEEIKSQYRLLALKHHPDRGGDLEKMQQINEAYNALIVSPEHKGSVASES